MENDKKPKVSVIMNGLNASKYLKEAIDSVFSQTYKDWEIIYWDDASTDNSLEIAKSYGPKVRCFQSEKTYPLGHVRNLALEKAQGEYLALLDCDDVWLPEKLEKQIPLFEKDPQVGLVFSSVIYFTPGGKDFQLHGMQKPPKGWVFREMLQNYFVCIPTVVVRKKALLGLSEWFDNRFSHIEEADLFYRIAHDWKFDYVDEALAKYRIHSESWSFMHRESAVDEKEIMIEKYIKLYPNFEKEYSNELAEMRNKIGYEKFSSYWLKGDAKKGRECLKPYLKWNRRLIPFIFSYFFPPSFLYFLFWLGIKAGVLKRKVYFHKVFQ